MRINYFLGETVTNLKRNLLMTIAAISTVAISLLLLGGVQILGMIVNNVTLNWEAKVEVSAFLRDDATQGEVKSLETRLSQMSQVQGVSYVSKQQAFNEFKQQYRNQPQYWQALSPDSLPASLRVNLTDAKFAPEIALNLQGAPGVADVKYGGDIIKRLLQVNSLLRTVTLVMSVVLLIAAAALIANTIRLAIYSRRDEIGIMKLVGATNWFIRVPFMLEGLFAALVGAAVSGGIVYLANQLIFAHLGNTLPFLGPVFDFSAGEIVGVLGLLVGVGALVGLLGSSMALRRFLEV
jgi:cell division transport system permease protein